MQQLSDKITEQEQAEKELERIRLELYFEEQEEKARQAEKVLQILLQLTISTFKV